MSARLPRVVADTPLDATIEGLLRGRVEVVPWAAAGSGAAGPVEAEGIYTYGHPTVDAAMMDRIAGLKVISNYGVGVDHIRLADADGAGDRGGEHARRARGDDRRPGLRAVARLGPADRRGGPLREVARVRPL